MFCKKKFGKKNKNEIYRFLNDFLITVIFCGMNQYDLLTEKLFSLLFAASDFNY